MKTANGKNVTDLVEFEIDWIFDEVMVDGTLFHEMTILIGNPQGRLSNHNKKMYTRHPSGTNPIDKNFYQRTVIVTEGLPGNENRYPLEFRDTGIYEENGITEAAIYCIVKQGVKEKEKDRRRTIVHVSSGGGGAVV